MDFRDSHKTREIIYYLSLYGGTLFRPNRENDEILCIMPVILQLARFRPNVRQFLIFINYQAMSILEIIGCAGALKFWKMVGNLSSSGEAELRNLIVSKNALSAAPSNSPVSWPDFTHNFPIR